MTKSYCHLLYQPYQLKRYSTTLFNNSFLFFLLDSILHSKIALKSVPRGEIINSFFSLNELDTPYYLLRYSTAFSCGIPLPFAVYHYPTSSLTRNVLQSFLGSSNSIGTIFCGIPLPLFNSKALIDKVVGKCREFGRFTCKRYSTTFCGVPLPLAVFYYLIIWYSTTLYAVFHYPFMRYYTTLKNFTNKLQSSVFKGFNLFFEAFIKLSYKTLFNYIIKELRTSLPFSSHLMFAYANAPMHLKEKENDL